MKLDRPLLLVLLTVALVACTANPPVKTTGAQGASPEEVVASRAQARWDAIAARDFGAAYSYLTPGTRTAGTPEAYARRMTGAAIRWTGATISKVTCDEPEVCAVIAQVSYELVAPMPGSGKLGATTPVVERWLRSDDAQWYHLPDVSSGLR